MVALQPDTRTVVQIRDGGGDLVLDQIRLTSRRIVSGCRIPAIGANVIAELRRITPATTGITAEDDLALRMPIIDRLKVAFLHHRHAHIRVINARFRRDGSLVAKERRQHISQSISFALLKLLREILTPCHSPCTDLQFVVEKIVQPLAGATLRMILKRLIKTVHNDVPGVLEHRVKRPFFAHASNTQHLICTIRRGLPC